MPTLTALLDALAATLPGYGSSPFELDTDYNIGRGIIEKIGVGKIVPRDKMPPCPDRLSPEAESLGCLEKPLLKARK